MNVIQHFSITHVDGKYLKSITRKEFGQNMVDFFENTKFRGTAMKYWFDLINLM